VPPPGQRNSHFGNSLGAGTDIDATDRDELYSDQSVAFALS
jgi:hypothetical protein